MSERRKKPRRDEDKLAYCPWYVRDFNSDGPVIAMSPLEEFCYRRLLDYQWLNGSIPLDVPTLARICKNISTRQMAKAWPALAPLFPNGINRRQDHERRQAMAAVATKAKAGEAGANAAWGPPHENDEAPNGARFVYAAEDSDGRIKIGVSRSPHRRVAAQRLTYLCSAPGSFDLERKAQVELDRHRVGSEWFDPHPDVLRWIETEIRAKAGPTANQSPAMAKPSYAEAETDSHSSQQQQPARYLELIGKFPLTGGSRLAITEFLDGLPSTENPDAWVGRMLNYLVGWELDPGYIALPEDIVTAVRDWNPLKSNWAPISFRSFVMTAINARRKREKPNGKSPGEGWDATL